MNLDSYQDRASQLMGETLRVPVLFLPQLMGLAFGMPEDELMFRRHVISVDPVLSQLSQ
jgi:heterodisulfide reductase subunit B